MCSMTASARRRQAEFDQQNLEAARVVLADPGRYPGLLQEWAKAVFARLEATGPSGGRPGRGDLLHEFASVRCQKVGEN